MQVVRSRYTSHLVCLKVWACVFQNTGPADGGGASRARKLQYPQCTALLTYGTTETERFRPQEEFGDKRVWVAAETPSVTQVREKLMHPASNRLNWPHFSPQKI